VIPYFGIDGINPFLRDNKITFIVAASSNPSGNQDYKSVITQDPRIGFVAPATKPNKLRDIRDLAPNQWLLVPGLGAQGGDLESTVKIAGNKALYVVGRDIINANEVRERAKYYRDAVTK
jgi:orotidine-5'-phosphate decarboxylase